MAAPEGNAAPTRRPAAQRCAMAAVDFRPRTPGRPIEMGGVATPERVRVSHRNKAEAKRRVSGHAERR